MGVRISLNGSDWQCKGYIGEDWVWRHAEKPGTRDLRGWLPATVPGSVHHDLWRAGEIPDPYVERNSLLVEWVPARTWVYRKRFVADPAWRGRRVRLHFEGVDYAALFFLNGEPLGEHRSMFTPVAFEVGEKLRYGEENLLAVVIQRAPDEEPQVSKTSYVRTHKSRMTYWWDFCPRMIHLGIWDSVYLEVTGPVRVEDLWVRPRLTADFARADVAMAVALSSAQAAPVEAEVEATIRFGGQVVARERSRRTVPPGADSMELTLAVEQPRLWWPNGHGEQPLYEAEVRVVTGGDESHLRRVPFGIRQVEWVPNETPDASARPYTAVVNGKRIYIKGWNLVPIDVMYGVERPEKLERLLTLARQAHVNLLRVWGGGLIEKEGFYDLCDRYGIMVWQEFIQSSSGIANKPSEDPDFVAMMVREAEHIIPRRRNHPSLVIWCGGNELTDLDGAPLDEREPVLGALKQVVERLDPDRYFLPTSPTGRQFGNTPAAIERDPDGLHDVHGPWEHQGLTGQYELYNRGTSLLHSEFGAEGMTNLKALSATIAPERQWPANRENPVYFHRGAWWINEPLVQECFGGINDVPTLVRASQFLQAEALRYALESNRRRKWQSSGSIPWQFNEPYPNAWCTSALDYYAQPKAAYYAVAVAYEPIHVSARFPTQVWAGRERFAAELFVSSSEDRAREGAWLQVRVVGAGGRVYLDRTEPVAVPANAAAPAGAVSLPLEQVGEPLFFLDLMLKDADGAVSSANRYLFSKAENLAPMLALPRTNLVVERAAEGQVRVTNAGATAALLVRLEDSGEPGAPGYAYFDANHFCLLPGESRRVRVEWTGVPEGRRPVEVTAWNADGVLIDV